MAAPLGYRVACEPQAEGRRPLLRVRAWWKRRQAAKAAQRSRRRLRQLGSVPAHRQSRYGLMKSREEAL